MWRKKQSLDLFEIISNRCPNQFKGEIVHPCQQLRVSVSEPCGRLKCNHSVHLTDPGLICSITLNVREAALPLK